MSLAEFAEFSSELVLDNGRPMALYPEQELMLADYFDGVRETLILIGKKSGKTHLCAALCLYHLLVVRDAEVVVAASSRDQATIVYDDARGFVRRTPALQDLIETKRGYRELRNRADDGRIRVLVADVDRMDGALPTLAVIDEFHPAHSSELYGLLRDGWVGRGGQQVCISTVGDDLDSPLGRLRARAYAMPGMVRDGAYRHVRTPDFALHEWALDESEDRDDLDVVKTANPAPWLTIEELRKRRDSPSTTEWQFARSTCGVWRVAERRGRGDPGGRVAGVRGSRRGYP